MRHYVTIVSVVNVRGSALIPIECRFTKYGGDPPYSYLKEFIGIPVGIP
jgi:hypothetical protein